jgi:hypothetical protein
MNLDTPAVLLGALVVIDSEAPDRVAAQLVGLPELHVTAPTREEALKRLEELVREWLNSGRLAALDLPAENPLMKWFGYARNDPEFTGYLEEIRRQREDGTDNPHAETDDTGCSGSCLTPTT